MRHEVAVVVGDEEVAVASVIEVAEVVAEVVEEVSEFLDDSMGFSTLSLPSLIYEA